MGPGRGYVCVQRVRGLPAVCVRCLYAGTESLLWCIRTGEGSMIALHVSCTGGACARVGLRPVRVHTFGCVRGVLRVRVRCGVRRVRGVCGYACAGWVCLRPAFGIAGGCTGAGVCFHPGLDFRI